MSEHWNATKVANHPAMAAAEIDRLRAELEGAKDAYAKLEFTVADLNAENEALRESEHETQTYLDELRHIYEAQKRENEALREAGDGLVNVLHYTGGDEELITAGRALAAWRKAKGEAGDA